MNPPLLFASPALVVLYRWTAVLALAWAAHWGLRRHHPRWRLILWRGVLCCGLAAPLASSFHIPVLRIPIAAAAVSPADLGGLPSPPAAVNPMQRAESTGPAPQTPPAVTSIPGSANSAAPFHPPKSIPWGPVLLVVWVLGCACETFRLSRLHLRLFRLRTKTCRPSPDLQRLAEEIQRRLQARRKVKVQISDAVSSPFLCGLFKPAIILPSGLARHLSERELGALLSHEIAHLRQNDLLWCVAWRWIKALCWFHPLVWKVPAVHCLACEQEADRVASGELGEEGSYARMLARLALRVLALPAVETKLTLNGSSQIARRLSLLGQAGREAWNWRHSAAGFGLVGFFFLMTACCDFSNASPAGLPVRLPPGVQVSPPAQPSLAVPAASPNASGWRLTLELRDGSHLVGKSLDGPLNFHSPAMGDLRLTWAGIRSIECGASNSEMARLTAANGDVCQVQFGDSTVAVETSFGRTVLPVKLIRSAQVAPPAPPNAAGPEAARLTIELRDGSRVSGKSQEDTLNFHSAAMGDLKLTWADIRSIEYPATNADMARLTAVNGDVYEARFASSALPVETRFGKSDLPVKLIRSVKVLEAGAPGPLVREPRSVEAMYQTRVEP
jgi:beta-lactamase regulating signal transducer with metallopeptidase domain